MPNHVTNILVAEKEIIDSLRSEKMMCVNELDVMIKKEEPKNEMVELTVDFNTVVPMPEFLESPASTPAIISDVMECLSANDEALATMLQPGTEEREKYEENPDEWIKSHCAEALSQEKYQEGGTFSAGQFAEYFKNIVECGHASWYSWSIENWGTKWNAYDCERIDDRTVRFDTAWSCPINVMLALAAKFPGNLIHFKWADEDCGYNVGDATVIYNEDSPDGPFEVNNTEIKGGSPEAYRKYIEVKYLGELPDEMFWKKDGTLGWVDDEEDEDDDDSDSDETESETAEEEAGAEG